MLVTCPQCKSPLEVDDEISSTCPVCLYRIGSRPSAPPAYPPPSVVPLDEQVGRDVYKSQGAIALLAAVIIAGFVALFAGMSSNSRPATRIALVTIFAAAAGIGLVEWMTRPVKRKRYPSYEDYSEPAPPGTGEVPVLNYQSPPRRQQQVDPIAAGGKIFMQAAGGAILGFGGIILAGMARAPLLIALVPLAGLILIFVRGVRGLGIGLVLAVPFGILIIAGICGGL